MSKKHEDEDPFGPSAPQPGASPEAPATEADQPAAPGPAPHEHRDEPPTDEPKE